MCIKEQQQQHADASCVRSSSLVLFTRAGGQRREGWHCPSLHLLLHLWLSSVIFRGITKKNKKKYTGSMWGMFRVKGHRSFRLSGLILAQLTRENEIWGKTTTWLRISHPFSLCKQQQWYWYCLEWFTFIQKVHAVEQVRVCRLTAKASVCSSYLLSLITHRFENQTRWLSRVRPSIYFTSWSTEDNEKERRGRWGHFRLTGQPGEWQGGVAWCSRSCWQHRHRHKYN